MGRFGMGRSSAPGTYESQGGTPASPDVEDPPCDICGLDPASDCYCTECPVCKTAGDIQCYSTHLVGCMRRLTPDEQVAIRQAISERLVQRSRSEQHACDWCFGYWQEDGAPDDHPPDDGYTIIVKAGKASLVCDAHYDEYRWDPDEHSHRDAVVFLPAPDEEKGADNPT